MDLRMADGLIAEQRTEIAHLKRALKATLAGNVIQEAHIERLNEEIATWGRMWNDAALLEARVEALRDGTAQR